ncbi:MAG: cysteine hydrolase [Candidatus Pristimantibacillus lignocellulolyticus]|uniref:Cysteine hydrolase n=1 Tax=Candidatus Pristimantibacillus lignocellulolyticus TaxID=2994561 RepID=A0A9J6ZH04_9BACL|nr:MAG: cysteine hydrolase [Candidatus Pristimantibacillus lignocellulolyticus]
MSWKLKDQSALLIVDVQQDFCGPEGKMAQYGIDLSTIDPAVDQIERLIKVAHEQEVPILFIRLITDPVTDSRAMKSWYAKKGLDPEDSVAICRRGTFGAEDYRIAPSSADYIVEKQKYSAFVGTNIELLLQQLNVEHLIVTGVTTECCVDSTVRDAFMKDYEVYVVADACAAYEQDVHLMSINILDMNFATILSTEQLLSYWEGE